MPKKGKGKGKAAAQAKPQASDAKSSKQHSAPGASDEPPAKHKQEPVTRQVEQDPGAFASYALCKKDDLDEGQVGESSKSKRQKKQKQRPLAQFSATLETQQMTQPVTRAAEETAAEETAVTLKPDVRVTEKKERVEHRVTKKEPITSAAAETTPLPKQDVKVFEKKEKVGVVSHMIPKQEPIGGAEALKPEEQHEKVSQKKIPKPQESLQKDIVEKMTGLSLVTQSHTPKFELAKRPGVGTLGRPIALLANYFMLTYKDVCIYHYDVDICEVDKNKKVGKSLMAEGMTKQQAIVKKVEHVEHQQKRSIGVKKCREIISKMTQSSELKNFSAVYDGQKNIYTSKAFPFKEEKKYFVDLEINKRIKTYCVILKPVLKENKSNVISLEPLKQMYAGRSTEIPKEALMVFETVMAHRETNSNQVRARNSFFFLEQTQNFDLGSGLEVWFGYNQSVHFTQRGPVVVINLAAKAFHKEGSVIDYAKEVLNCDITKNPLQKYHIMDLEKALKKVGIEVTHLPYRRKYNVQGVCKLSAKDQMIEIDNRKTSVAQYFATKYKPLKFPMLPCLSMRTQKPTYVPMENCYIYKGQPKLGKVDPSAAAYMIRGTAVAPDKRFNTILNDAKTVANLSKKPMQDFGLFMDTKLMELNGRVLTAPALSYDGKEQAQTARPDNRGVWRMDGKKFFRPQIINNWILMSFAPERQCPEATLQRFATCLTRSGDKLGLRLGTVEIRIFTGRDKTRAALDYAKKKAAIAVVVLNRRDRIPRYAEVKFIADFELGLVTQCMEDKVVGRVDDRNDQITNNICLKLNLKLGGVNHKLFQQPQVFREPCIVMGADAIHWPRDYGYPSIAAVVGSLDPYPSRYALTCRTQENRTDKKISQEIILEMKDIVADVLKKFLTVTKGRRPMKIIFFRDGVSDGQFKEARDIEVHGIQEACRELFNLVVPITYIIVQKRHQTRFRPKNPRDGIGKMGNIPAGTVIDSDVVHPVHYDYFLCSHEGIQGTSKPAHYTVMHDDNYLKVDELQQLTFHLCHMYGKCNRSVSLPAPVFYADLACARAKSYADLHIESDERSSVSSGSSPQRSLPDNVMAAINGMRSFDNNMFYI